MNYLILIIPFLTIAYLFYINFSGIINIGVVHGKLWSSIEKQLEALQKTEEIQKLKINELQELLQKNDINYTLQPRLSDGGINNPDSSDIISNIKNDFALLKYYYTRGKVEGESHQDQLQISRQIAGISTFGAAEYSSTDQTQEYCTLNGDDYKFVNITGATEFKFKLRVTSSGYIGLAYRPFEVEPMYDVIFGSKSNSETVIRKKGIPVATIAHGPLLKGCEFMGFWVRWKDNAICVGYETDTKPLLQYNATDLYKVNYIGLKTYNAVGNWIIY